MKDTSEKSSIKDVIPALSLSGNIFNMTGIVAFFISGIPRVGRHSQALVSTLHKIAQACWATGAMHSATIASVTAYSEHYEENKPLKAKDYAHRIVDLLTFSLGARSLKLLASPTAMSYITAREFSLASLVTGGVNNAVIQAEKPEISASDHSEIGGKLANAAGVTASIMAKRVPLVPVSLSHAGWGAAGAFSAVQRYCKDQEEGRGSGQTVDQTLAMAGAACGGATAISIATQRQSHYSLLFSLAALTVPTARKIASSSLVQQDSWQQKLEEKGTYSFGR